MTDASAGRWLLGEGILAAHVAIIGFNLFGLIAIPLGAWLRWAFVHGRVWRLLHLASLGVVALQAVLGRACFLTVWEADVVADPSHAPLILRWVNGLIFWPLPMWAFNAVYIALFLYVLALLWLVPPGRAAPPASTPLGGL
jgi:hypothetical protein